MRPLYCWRCDAVVPMLDEAEFDALLEVYDKKTHRDVLLHHRLALYGPPCEGCGKPYRSPNAIFCAACGHRRPGFQR